MTRRSAAQEPARRPLDWLGLGGSQSRFSAIEERRGGSGAQCRAGRAPGPRQVRAEAGRRRAGRGPRGGRGLAAGRSGFATDLGSGPARGERGAWSPDPVSGPATVGNPPRAPEPPTARSCRPHGDPRVGVPASGSAQAPGCLSLRGPRRPGAGESEPPPHPAPSPGSPHLPPRNWGGVTPLPSVSSPDPRSPGGTPVCEPLHPTPENGAPVSSPEGPQPPGVTPWPSPSSRGWGPRRRPLRAPSGRWGPCPAEPRFGDRGPGLRPLPPPEPEFPRERGAPSPAASGWGAGVQPPALPAARGSGLAQGHCRAGSSSARGRAQR